jgi:hypothetical protein
MVMEGFDEGSEHCPMVPRKLSQFHNHGVKKYRVPLFPTMLGNSGDARLRGLVHAILGMFILSPQPGLP